MSQFLSLLLGSTLLLTATYANQLLGAASDTANGPGSNQSCPVPDARKSQTGNDHKVQYVIDGDTLELSSGIRVRIIGINAPELERKTSGAQPFAYSSRNLVLDLLSSTSNTVRLIPGTQTLDEYGRSLYHVQLADNRNLAIEMLRNGMAVQSAVAPNTLCASTYANAEISARNGEKGIWQNADFWRKNKRKLDARTKGFFMVTGRVKYQKLLLNRKKKQTKSSPDSHYLKFTLQNGLIVTFDQPSTLTTSDLTGKLIEVRGWIYTFKGKPRLNLHHSANLTIIE